MFIDCAFLFRFFVLEKYTLWITVNMSCHLFSILRQGGPPLLKAAQGPLHMTNDPAMLKSIGKISIGRPVFEVGQGGHGPLKFAQNLRTLSLT